MVLKHNPIRDVTPLEQDRDRTARALSVEEVRDWLAILDADPVARRKDLPELARFILATGLRLGRRSVCGGATSTWTAVW
jgi:site-specific recombinase XerC